MAFQFLCPQGHLLQGDESQAGQQCKCPYCGGLFVVPQPLSAAPAEPPQPEPTPPPGLFGAAGSPAAVSPEPGVQGYGAPSGGGPADFGWAEQPSAPQIQDGGFSAAGAYSGVAGGFEQGPSLAGLPGGSAGPQIVHIICPSGHELETPGEMLGQDALCPYCQVQFRLRYEDSVEYRRQKQEERELHEARLGKAWMQWSIVAAVVVVLGVILLIAMATMR